MLRPALGLALLVTVSASADPTPRFLSPKEVMARIQASKSTYSVRSEPLGSNPADTMWPLVDRWPDSPVVVADGARNKVVARVCSPDAAATIATGDRDFKAKRFAEARRSYEAATQREPDCMRAWLYLGDSFFFEGDSDRALTAYEHAVALRPDDAVPYFFRGQTLLRLGRRADGIADFRKALAIHPHYATLLTFLSGAADKLGLELHDGFTPRALVKGTAPAIDVYVQSTLPPADGTAWMGWATCKALWLGDEAHRREMTGQGAHVYTTTEEKECLVDLLYLVQAQHATSPELQRLRAIVEAGVFDAFIVYELAARLQPTIILTLSPPQRALVQRYVTEFVLVDHRAR